MSYISRLKELSLKEKESLSKIGELNKEKDKEIRSVLSFIEETYRKTLKEVQDQVYLLRYEKDMIISKITEASLFDIHVIGPVMAKIVSAKENVEYEFVSEDLDGHFVYMICPKDERKLDDKNIFVFNERMINGEYVVFYNNFIIEIPISFGRFEYLKNFIDMVVEYRLEDSISCVKYLDASELEKLKDKFLDVKSRKLDFN